MKCSAAGNYNCKRALITVIHSAAHTEKSHKVYSHHQVRYDEFQKEEGVGEEIQLHFKAQIGNIDSTWLNSNN